MLFIYVIYSYNNYWCCNLSKTVAAFFCSIVNIQLQFTNTKSSNVSTLFKVILDQADDNMLSFVCKLVLKLRHNIKLCGTEYQII